MHGKKHDVKARILLVFDAAKTRRTDLDKVKADCSNGIVRDFDQTFPPSP